MKWASPLTLQQRLGRKRVRAGPQRQLLQISDPFEVPCLRCREDLLSQSPYIVLGRTPVHGVPVEGNVVRSVRHRIKHGGVQLVHRFRPPRSSHRHRLT